MLEEEQQNIIETLGVRVDAYTLGVNNDDYSIDFADQTSFGKNMCAFIMFIEIPTGGEKYCFCN